MSKNIQAMLDDVTRQVKELRELLEAKKNQGRIGLPDSMKKDGFVLTANGSLCSADPDKYTEAFDYGNRFRTREQAEAFSHAWSVMLRIRRMPGIVDPDDGAHYLVRVRVVGCEWSTDVCEYWDADHTNGYMFPAFDSRESAQAAIDAIGADNLIKCAKTLAFVGAGGES